MTRHAFISVYERRFAEAVPMLELAGRLARRGDRQLSTRYWVSAVTAQAFAGLGEVDACQRATDAAAEVERLTGAVHNGGWLRFDGSRLAEERGACFVELRRPDLAEPALTDALAQHLPPRRRAAVLTDLATVGVHRHDPDQVIHYAVDALAIAQRTGSGVVIHRLHGLHTQLAPLRDHPEVRDLDDQITRLAATPTT
jgi:hypothetical protein